MNSLRPGRHVAPRMSARRVVALCLAASSLSLVANVGSSGAASKKVVIASLKTAKFGTILVSGTTVYTLSPSKIGCTIACQKYWPEVLLAKGIKEAIAGKGVKSSKLGSIARPGGVRQVTYGGKALYWFSLDASPGQVKGNVTDTWGTWSDVVLSKPAGSVQTTTTTRPDGTTTTQPSTTTRPSTTTTSEPTTTTTAPSGGGVGF